MNLSNDYMLVLEEIRTSKKISVVELCQDIITERTYYRMLKSKEVRTDVFSQLTDRLGIDLSEIIHYAAFVKKNDPRFKFLYRVHTKFYRDIEEHYQALIHYQDPSDELDLLLNVYKKKYLYETNQMSKEDYHTHLIGYLPLIQANTVFNIYLFTIQLEMIKELPNHHDFSLKEVANNLYNEEFSYSVILVAICYDALLLMLLKSNNEDEAMIKLMSKYEMFTSHFPSRYFLMRYNLYKAYIGKVENQDKVSNQYLFKFLMNALSMLEDDDYQQQEILVTNTFKINCTEFLYRSAESILI